MNYNDIVPMISEPKQFPSDTFLASSPTRSYESETPQYIQDLLTKEMMRLREKNNFTGFGFGRDVYPDKIVERLRSRGPNYFYSPEAGTFSVSELNQLLRDDYDARLYDLIQSKSRANATQNILNSILGEIQGYSPIME